MKWKYSIQSQKVEEILPYKFHWSEPSIEEKRRRKNETEKIEFEISIKIRLNGLQYIQSKSAKIDHLNNFYTKIVL